ncbi:MFS transporter [Maribacter sp. CXY002]|uniref:MFS transporter n=1 Tax=Maribacter luteocoastalis TaxID=3407671 RepID=UPI003B677038
MKIKPHILPVIVIAQFACTSPWFAGNTIIDELTLKTGLGTEIMGWVLSSVQLGFIIGTLVYAIFMIADRFAPSKVFMFSAVIAALCNLWLLQENLDKWDLLFARFGTGFFLAGIYPVGMKIASDYYEQGLGRALGFLVGALVLGTAFPYLVNGTLWGSNPDTVIKLTSAFTVFGGLAINFLVPNGPFRKASNTLDFSIGTKLFGIVGFRKAAFGYFGHMWELYAFWAFTPFAISSYNEIFKSNISISFWTGIVIAFGGLSSAIGGLFSQKWGSKKVAVFALTISGIFCLISPLLFQSSTAIFLGGWCLWGMAVTADSPQFSSLVASSLSPELKGTGLTLVNCLGFGITIVSIQLLALMTDKISPIFIFIILSIGPIIGLSQLMGAKNN